MKCISSWVFSFMSFALSICNSSCSNLSLKCKFDSGRNRCTNGHRVSGFISDVSLVLVNQLTGNAIIMDNTLPIKT